MRILYFLLWIAFHYSFRLYFRKIKVINPFKAFFGRTIYVSNHQGSFMDPLLIASQHRPIVYFMVRSDVFNKFTNPLLWMVHMLPIYRQRDGVDTKAKNAKVFEKTNEVLKRNRNILIFGEGFTDDRIQRRLHPIKKGAARIGFSALDYCEWKEDVYLQGLGVNYTDFNLRGSDVVIAVGNKIKLNDYREAYKENPAKTIAEVTRLLEINMRELITDVHDTEWADVHEDVMMLTRKGMHPQCFDDTISLVDRWKYSMALGEWFNRQSDESLRALSPLVNQIQTYKTSLKELGISENERFLTEHNQWGIAKKMVLLFFLLPFALLGLLHASLPYIVVKRWVEKKFKRPVFWGSTKKVIAFFACVIINIPVLIFLPKWLPFTVTLNVIISVLYYLAIGLFAQAFLASLKILKELKRWRFLGKLDLREINNMHRSVTERLHQQIPS